MNTPMVTHAFVRSLARRLKSRFGIDAKHTDVLAEIAGALSMSADALMHALKNAPSDPERIPEPDDWKRPYREMALTAGIRVADSVQIDGIVCLLDGQKRKMMSRHLRSIYNLTPEQYREIFDLPPDYPMVAPGHDREKRVVARAQGLGMGGPGLNLPPDVLERVKPGFMRHLVSPFPVERTLTDEFIICLLDRVAVTSLRDHLASEYGLSETDYRRMFGLPDNYPMDVEEARKRGAEE